VSETFYQVISGKDINWPKLIESAESVGRQMEEEVDHIRRDEQRRLRSRLSARRRRHRDRDWFLNARHDLTPIGSQ
jgi:hypothetical protein